VQGAVFENTTMEKNEAKKKQSNDKNRLEDEFL
jgi:hypothetical protein